MEHLCHLSAYFFFSHRTLNSSKVTRSPESLTQNFANILCFDVSLFWWRGTFQWSRAVQRGTVKVNRKAHRHTHTRTLFELLARTPVYLKKRATQSISLFSIPQPWGDTPLFFTIFVPCAFWSVPEKGSVSWSTICERPLDAELVITLLWKAFYWCAVLHTRKLRRIHMHSRIQLL